MNDNNKPDLSDALRSPVYEQMARRLQGLLPERDEAVDEMIHVHPETMSLWVLLTPDERLRWIRRRLEVMINITPSGPERDALTEANICVGSRIAGGVG